MDYNIKLSDSVETFSSKLKAKKDIIPKWYYVGDRKINVLHAKLRMLCSTLNDHLFSFIHVVDDPSCSCGHFRENNKHFLLECLLYGRERNIMIQKLELLKFKPTLKNLLFGDKNYEENKNSQAFKIIQEYINDTNRF